VHNAVFDTGPLIHLHEINRLELVLTVFNMIHLPEQVQREIHNEAIIQFLHQNTICVSIHSVNEPELFVTKEAYSGFQLHLADLALLSLLPKIKNAVAVTDDLALRKAIESGGITAVGTIGILLNAYKRGVIDKPQLIKLLDLSFNDSSLYLSSAFKARVVNIVDTLT
jgi:predicted nucleic acid-binding protein